MSNDLHIKRNDVFVSYSHQDKEWLTEVKRHFKFLERQIHFWDDNKITAGSYWRKEIDQALDRCKVAVLLVSADFIASDFIMEVELPYLLTMAKKGEITLLVVILKPCLFNEVQELSTIQAVNSPSNPVISMTVAEREKLWVHLSMNIKSLFTS